jgi:hypothetical protein
MTEQEIVDRIKGVVLDDQTVQEYIHQKVVESLGGWQPLVDEDEKDPRYDTYYDRMSLTIMKLMGTAIGQMTK